jgi:REP element-mobilizing transposase RayT
MLRGIERRVIFVDDVDRAGLLERLSRVLTASGVRCYAWAFMPNHIHLVLRTDRVPLSRLMARIGTGHAVRFNERHDRVGHLFQNRFKSRVVEDDADLVGLVRYVHLNPLAGGLVRGLRALERYRWCRHGALMGRVEPAPFHGIVEALALFGEDSGAARTALASWMREGWERGVPAESLEPDAPVRRERPAPTASAGDRQWHELLRVVAEQFAVSRDALVGNVRVRPVARGRAVLAHLAVHHLGWTLAEVGARLALSPSAVSRAVIRGAADREASSIERALASRSPGHG